MFLLVEATRVEVHCGAEEVEFPRWHPFLPSLAYRGVRRVLGFMIMCAASRSKGEG
jgi:hypothetical protein